MNKKLVDLGFRNNFLFYTEKNKQYQEMKKILENLEIKYVEVRLNEAIVDEKFIVMLVERSVNGFDDLIKSPKRYMPELDLDEIKFDDFVKYIVENYENALKTAIFFGKLGASGDYRTTSGAVEDEYTVYIDYNKREMSEIYE